MFKKKSEQEIMSLYRKRPGECIGALRVDKALNYDPGGTAKGEQLSRDTHKILQELEKKGFLKQCKGHGFCYYPENK